jgi:hypothetical protein
MTAMSTRTTVKQFARVCCVVSSLAKTVTRMFLLTNSCIHSMNIPPRNIEDQTTGALTTEPLYRKAKWYLE